MAQFGSNLQYKLDVFIMFLCHVLTVSKKCDRFSYGWINTYADIGLFCLDNVLLNETNILSNLASKHKSRIDLSLSAIIGFSVFQAVY